MKEEDNPFEDSKVAQEWIDWVESSSPGGARHSQIYPFVKNWLTVVNPKTVVDIGSGQGVVSECINLEKTEYIGIEPSESLVKNARELYGGGNRKFVVGSAYALPIEDAWADAAFSVYVWMHLGNLNKASQELARILRPGGSFLIFTANPGAYDVWKSFYSDTTVNGNKVEGRVSINGKSLSRNNFYLHPRQKMKKALLDSGLTIDEVETFGYGDEHGDEGLHISIKGAKPS